MDKTLTLYHGSSLIIERPQFGKGNPFNDYGLGFYCTETLELAKEWACSMEQDGFATGPVGVSPTTSGRPGCRFGRSSPTD